MTALNNWMAAQCSSNNNSALCEKFTDAFASVFIFTTDIGQATILDQSDSSQVGPIHFNSQGSFKSAQCS